jgi:hypothetical protein
MKALLTILFFGLISNVYSQDGKISIVYTPDSVKHINRTFLYPGGQEALLKDIENNFKMPKQARKDNLHGEILLQIRIDTLGKASGTILKGLREDVDKAAIDMTKKLKQSIPAQMDDLKVPFNVKVPIKL